MANPKIDWLKARDEYIKVKEMSLKGISHRYGISYSRVRAIATQEEWVKKKQKQWDKAAEEALEETQGSIKDLISRHSRVARYLQAGGLKYLKAILDELTEAFAINSTEGRKLLKTLIVNKIITTRTLMAMISEGLKAERELYPKQMQFKGDMTFRAKGLSPALERAINEAFKRELKRKPKEARGKRVSKK